MSLFRARGLKRLHLGPLDLEVAASEILCISGPSGCGKSLLLRTLADLDPHEGTVALGDIEQASCAATEWRHRVTLLAAESQWWAPTVGEHFPDDNAERFSALGFSPDVARWEVERLSSGEKQRLALLRAMAHGPTVLLLDEPTANLDDDNANNVERLVSNWRQEGQRAVVWISHDRVQIARVCGRHLVMTQEGNWKA